MKKLTSLLLAGALALVLIPSAAAQPYTLKKLWDKGPDDYSEFLVTSHLERGMAYNPTTGHLLIPSRAGTPAIHIIEAEDGSYVGTLDMGSGVVSGGDFLINKIAIAEDGAIYVGNLTTGASSVNLHLYRWENEQSTPVRVYRGNPGGGNTSELRWGDSLALRGTGADTEILVGSYTGKLLGILRPGTADPAAPDSYTVQPVWVAVTEIIKQEGEDDREVEANGFMRNLAFGPDNLVYVTTYAKDLYELEIDFESGEVVNNRAFRGNHVTRYLSPIAYGAQDDIVVGLTTASNHEIWVYPRGHLTDRWLVSPRATIRFSPTLSDGTYTSNGNATGEVVIVGSTIYALDTNNGIMAVEFVTADPVHAGDLVWSNAEAIRTAKSDGSDARTLIPGLDRPIGLFVDTENGHIYWAEDGAGRIARANLNGESITTIISNRGDEENPLPIGNPQGITIVNDRIYWTEYSGGLFSANLDGSDPQALIDLTEELANTGTSPGTSAIAWDSVTQKLHMTATIAGRLHTIDPDGSDEVVTTYPTNAYGITFDDSGTLYRTNFSGNIIESLAPGASATTLFGSRQMPLGIALSDDGTRLFWAERTGGHIYMANANGSGNPVSLIAGENSPFGITVVPSVTSTEGFADWIAGYDLTTEEQAPDADPDGDGLSNLLEYALGGDPTSADRDLAPILGTETIGEDSYVSIAYLKNEQASGITYQVEVSSDLVNWESGEAVSVVSEDATAAIIRDTIALTESNRRFIRLRIATE